VRIDAVSQSGARGTVTRDRAINPIDSLYWPGGASELKVQGSSSALPASGITLPGEPPDMRGPART
jgi:hypothetical protein